jgi:hypothetical protein
LHPVVESCNATFDKAAPCPRDIFECAGDKEIDESIFVYEELQSFDCDEDESLLPSTSSPEVVPASTFKVEVRQATTSFTAAVEVSQVEGEIISDQGAPSHIQKAHPPQQIIDNLNERVTQFLDQFISPALPTLSLLLYLSLEMLDMLFLIQVGSMSCMRS